MRITPEAVLHGLAKPVAAVVAAGAVGTGLGIGLAEVSGGGGGAAVAPQTTASSPTTTADDPATTARPTATTPASATTASSAPTSTAPPQNVSRTTRVQILSAVLYPAASARGRSRGRARLIVRVRLTSRSTGTLPARTPVLIIGTAAIRIDRHAADAADALLRPLAPSQTATGELFFETASYVTQQLTTQARARLSIARRTVEVPIRVSTTPARPR